MKRAPQKSSRRRRGKSTTGTDDQVSQSGRTEYYVADALEVTPHARQRLVSTLKKPIMGRKLKYSVLESSLVGSGAASASAISLVTINQGTTDITRTGDRIRAKRLSLAGRITGGTTQGGPLCCRLIVVCWNVPGVGAVNVPVSGQVLQGSNNYLPFAAYSRDYGDQYQVVYDSIHSIQAATTTSESQIIRMERDLTIDMEFAAGATTPMVNGLYLFFVTESAGVTTAQPNVYWQSTLWYEDLDA